MTKQVFIFYVFFPKETCALMSLSLQRCYVDIFANKDKNTGIIIVVKCNEEEEYPYIPIRGQHSHRKYRTGILLAHN